MESEREFEPLGRRQLREGGRERAGDVTGLL